MHRKRSCAAFASELACIPGNQKTLQSIFAATAGSVCGDASDGRTNAAKEACRRPGVVTGAAPLPLTSFVMDAVVLLRFDEVISACGADSYRLPGLPFPGSVRHQSVHPVIYHVFGICRLSLTYCTGDCAGVCTWLVMVSWFFAVW